MPETPSNAEWAFASDLPQGQPEPATRSAIPVPKHGEVLGGNYRLVSEIARGAMGVVFRARDMQAARDVAIKVVLATRLAPRQRERFLREGQITAGLDHPGIVRVHDCGEHEGRPYLVYELIEGSLELDDALRGLPKRARAERIRDVARALGHAHAHGVVHRDVKPANVLVDRDGAVRVADFGLAVSPGADRLTRTGEMVGTPSYMAPEQVRGEVGVESPATDVWALGVMLFEALSDEMPFRAASFLELMAQIVTGSIQAERSVIRAMDPALYAVCRRALQVDPTQRYPNGEAFALALDMALSAPTARGPSARTVVLGLVTVLLILGGVAAARHTPAERAPEPVEAPPKADPIAPPPTPRPPPKSLDEVLMIQAGAERLAALDAWLAASPPTHPRRAEAQASRAATRYDLPLAHHDFGERVLGAWFVDEDRVVVQLYTHLELWRLVGEGAPRREGSARPSTIRAVPGPGGPRRDLLATATSPNWVLRGRSVEAWFTTPEPGELVPSPGRDLGFKTAVTKIARSVDDSNTVFAVLSDSPQGSPQLRVFSHALGAVQTQEQFTATVGGERSRFLAITPDGEFVVTAVRMTKGSSATELTLWRARSGERVWYSEMAKSPTDLAISPDGTRLAIPTLGDELLLFQLPGDGTPRPLRGGAIEGAHAFAHPAHSNGVRGAVFSADSRTLLSASSKDTAELRAWDVASGDELPEWRRLDLPDPIWAVARSPGGGRFLCLLIDKVVLRQFVPAER